MGCAYYVCTCIYIRSSLESGRTFVPTRVIKFPFANRLNYAKSAPLRQSSEGNQGGVEFNGALWRWLSGDLRVQSLDQNNVKDVRGTIDLSIDESTHIDRQDTYIIHHSCCHPCKFYYITYIHIHSCTSHHNYGAPVQEWYWAGAIFLHMRIRNVYWIVYTCVRIHTYVYSCASHCKLDIRT